MSVCLLLILLLSLCIMGFKCPDDIKRHCTCFTTKAGFNRRVERYHVDCSSRDLKTVPYLDFKNKLYALLLQNNSLTSLDVSDFATRVYVTYVDISNNPIGSSLENSLFENTLRGLTILKAAEIGLDLQNISSLYFLRNMHDLQELDISRNMEYGVDMLLGIFAEIETFSLKVLSLSLCRIKDVNPHAFIGLRSLREMDLSQNYLVRVPRALHTLPLLRKLSLRANDITVIYHGDFSDLNHLEELDLSKNRLTFRNGALFGVGKSLTHLLLQESGLSILPSRSLSELKNLKHLDISNNSIKIMTNLSFNGQYRLEYLDISSNPWVIDNDMFYNVKDTLFTLRMREAGLTFIPRVPLAQLTSLKVLDLSNNLLRFLDNDTLKGISARRLSFRGNLIRYVSRDAFSDYKRPIDLDLSFNKLDSLTFIFESEKCTLYKLNISSNGFLCECQIEKVVNSRRVHSLDGNCALKSGHNISFSNQSMIYDLESRCGKTDPTFCLWWAPKSSAEAFCHENVVSLIVSLTMYLGFLRYL